MVRHGHRRHHHHHSHHHHHRHRPRIIIPPTTDQTLVVPTNMYTGKFNTVFYSSGWSQDRIPSTELVQFLTPIEDLIQAYIQPTLSSIIRVLVFLPFIFALVLIIGAPIAFSTARDPFQVPRIIPAGVALVFGSVIILIVFACILNGRRAAQRPGMLSSVQSYIAQNEATFKAKGFYVVLPTHFPYWIEICKTVTMNAPVQNVFANPGVATQFCPQQQNMNTVMDINSSNIGLNENYNTSMQYYAQQPQNFGQVVYMGNVQPIQVAPMHYPQQNTFVQPSYQDQY